MTKSKTRLERLQRELDKRAPAEPIVIQIVYADDWRALDDSPPVKVIQMRWGDEDEEDGRKQTRQDAPGRA